MASYNKSFNFRNGVQVDNDNFIVNANGLVGIGTSIPREFLDVYGTAKVTGLVTTTNLYVSGIATFTNLKVGNVNISSGIITATTGIVTYYGDGSYLTNLPVSQWIDVDSGLGYTSIYSAGNVGIATTNPTYNFQVGSNPVTSNGVGFSSTGNVYISGIITAKNAVVTNLISTASTSTSLQVSGTGTFGTLNAPVGVVTTLSGTTLNYSTLNSNSGIVTTLSGTGLTYGTAGITTLTTTTGTITNLTNTNLTNTNFTSTASTITQLTNTNLRTTGIATIQTLNTVTGSIAYLSGESISVNSNIRSDTLNSNSGIVTTLSGTTIRYSGTGAFGTLNAPVGVVTTLSGTTLSYGGTGTFGGLTSPSGTISNLNSTNVNASGIITATTFIGNLLGNVGIGTTNPSTPLQVEIYGVKTGFGNFLASAGAPSDIDSFIIATNNFKTAEYTVHIQSPSSIQAQKVLVMQNGNLAFSEEYAIMYEPTFVVSIGATISGGLCKLQLTPDTGVTGVVTYRFVRNSLL